MMNTTRRQFLFGAGAAATLMSARGEELVKLAGEKPLIRVAICPQYPGLI